MQEQETNSRKRKHLPNVAIDDVGKGVASSIMTQLNIFDAMHCKKRAPDMTDSELRNAIDNIIETCIRNDVRIGVELLSLALGITRQTFYRWTQGVDCGRERQEICQNARQFISAYIEQLSLTGKLNPATSIFLYKNICGYRDVVEYVEEHPQQKALTLAELPKLEELDKQSTKANALSDSMNFDNWLDTDAKRKGDDDELLYM